MNYSKMRIIGRPQQESYLYELFFNTKTTGYSTGSFCNITNMLNSRSCSVFLIQFASLDIGKYEF